MALPVATSPAGIPADYCCDTLSKVADRIRTVAFDGIETCLDPTCADRAFRSYVTVGSRVEDPLGDSLIVHMLRVGPTPRSTSAPGRLLPVATHLATFRVQLLETGWPVGDSDEMTQTITVADFEIVHRLAMHAMSHGELMYRSLVDSIQRREMFTGVDNDHIGDVDISPLEPINPSAYLVGFTATVTVQLALQ